MRIKNLNVNGIKLKPVSSIQVELLGIPFYIGILLLSSIGFENYFFVLIMVFVCTIIHHRIVNYLFGKEKLKRGLVIISILVIEILITTIFYAILTHY